MERKFSPWIGGSILASLVSGPGPVLALTIEKGQPHCLACLLTDSHNKHLVLRKGSQCSQRDEFSIRTQIREQRDRKWERLVGTRFVACVPGGGTHCTQQRGDTDRLGQGKVMVTDMFGKTMSLGIGE